MKLPPSIVSENRIDPTTSAAGTYKPIAMEKERHDSAAILPAVRVDKGSKTDRAWLNETCLDARDVPDLKYVKLDDRSWHADQWFDDYGEHLTYYLYDENDNLLDTCHAYQEMTASNCLVTFCGKNYGGHGIPKGDGYYAYLSDTHPF